MLVLLHFFNDPTLNVLFSIMFLMMFSTGQICYRKASKASFSNDSPVKSYQSSRDVKIRDRLSKFLVTFRQFLPGEFQDHHYYSSIKVVKSNIFEKLI